MSKTIFIIEDDIFLQGLEATKLKKEGFEIQTAASGKEVISIVEKKIKIDLILLDLMLPDMDGFEILKKIRSEQELLTTPIIIFSNLSEEKDIEKAKSLGVKDFMVKSNFNLDELTVKIRELIGK
jgi:DNA-binding response OmpR family regulator